MADSKLAAAIGTEYARMLHTILPKIEEPMSRGLKGASFTVTAKFRALENGEIEVILSQNASIPMDKTAFKLSFRSGQLSLFEGSANEPDKRAI
jgi:hypothetical protein